MATTPATIEQILFHRNLTGVIKSIKSGIPNPIPEAFYTVDKRVSGNRAEYYRITGSRKVARAVAYGSPALRRELRSVDLVNVTLLHTYESIQWPMALTLAMSKMGSLEIDKLGKEQAEYQSAEFKRVFSNLRIAAVAQMLFGVGGASKLYFDGKGNLLASSAGAAWNVDYQIPSTNIGAVSALLSGQAAAASWATAGTPIITGLQQLKTAALKLHGYPLTHAFYGDKVAEYIGANTTAQQYLKLNPAMNQAFIGSPTQIPNGFAGIDKWIHCGSMFYEDSAGTKQQLCGDSQIVLTPTPDTEWVGMFEGSFPVPKSVLPVMGATAADVLSNVAEEFGMFQYGLMALNPPTVEQYAGDTFLPVLKVPAAITNLTSVVA